VPSAAGPDDPYPPSLERARAELAACGHPEGFATTIAVRSDRPDDVAGAAALSGSLARIGVTARVQALSPFQWGGTAGRPAYVHAHRIGILVDDQAADWPTGYGFLEPVADGRSIAAVGNTDLMELTDPAVDRLLDQGQATADPAARAAIWARAAQAVMATAAFVPLTDARTLLYRGQSLTGVTVQQAYGMYDYTLLGH
jgi:peptide/nickel transport system substrate-binding protein